MKHLITIFTGIILAATVAAQNRVVHGKLKVFNTYPVKNVEVNAKKSKATIHTDSLGQFNIVCYEKDVIRIKSKTFNPVNVRVGSDTDSLEINLIYVDNKVNRERMISSGYLEEKDLLYAIDHLAHENNEFCSYANIFDLIKGRFSGVMVTGNHIYVRGGLNSFSGANQALYIVNGVESSSLDWITPCQINTINILKDANASMYGSRGANGVVVIEMRKEL